jgi:hypothetical protein
MWHGGEPGIATTALGALPQYFLQL